MKRSNVIQIVMPLTAAFIWGSAFVAQALGAEVMGAFTFSATRMTIAIAVMFLMLPLLRKLSPKADYPDAKKYRRDLVLGGLVCGFSLCAACNLQQFGLTDTDAGKAGFITALYVMLVPVFSIFLGKKITRRVALCVALAVAGLYCICFEFGKVPVFVGGDFFVFLCTIFFAVQVLAVDHFVAKVDSIDLSIAQFVGATIFSYIGMFIFDEPTMDQVVRSLPYLIYVGVFSGAVAYTLQIIAQREGDPTKVSILLSLESLFAVVCSAILLGERMSGQEYVGCALMMVAVIFSQIPEKQKVEEKHAD
ncbi:MAG: DMT family transporter [Oscillospiraceae bacterium]|nr:DMT family transporter [Oscillospiraceae bacterium]